MADSCTSQLVPLYNRQLFGAISYVAEVNPQPSGGCLFECLSNKKSPFLVGLKMMQIRVAYVDVVGGLGWILNFSFFTCGGWPSGYPQEPCLFRSLSGITQMAYLIWTKNLAHERAGLSMTLAAQWRFLSWQSHSHQGVCTLASPVIDTICFWRVTWPANTYQTSFTCSFTGQRHIFLHRHA